MFTPLAFTKESIVTRGLVFHVDAADRTSYSPSNTVWNDLTSNGNDGTLTNGPTFDSGNGGSIEFDGANDYIELGSINSSNPLSLYNIDNFSISFWMYADSAAGDNYQRIIDKSNGGNASNGWCIVVGDIFPNKRLGILIGGSSAIDTFSDSNAYTHNEWTFVTFTKQETNFKLYINASSYLTATSNNTVPSTTTNCRIGSWNHSTAREFIGKISNLMIYHKTLSSSEITQNYNALKGRFGL